MLGLLHLFACSFACAQDPRRVEGNSSKAVRQDAIRALPLQQLGRTGETIRPIVERPTYFRRMPTKVIECDPDMFTFLVRRPEVMVNIWDIMGITKVSAERINQVAFLADDAVGTVCRCELIYATPGLHIYMGDGTYDGSLTPRKVTGKCVCVLRSKVMPETSGTPKIAGTMDVFLKLDNLGADLVARSVAPFVGKTADYNFSETAEFISQVSQICKRSPIAAQNLARQLQKVEPGVRTEFGQIAARIGMRDIQDAPLAMRTPKAPVAQTRPPLALYPTQRQTQDLGLTQPQPPTRIRLSDSSGSSRETSAAANPWSGLQSSLAAPNSNEFSSRPSRGKVAPAPAAIVPQKRKIYMRR